MVAVAAFGWLTMLQAAVLAAVGMIAFGCCSPNQALRSIDWSVLMVIASGAGTWAGARFYGGGRGDRHSGHRASRQQSALGISRYLCGNHYLD